MKIFFLLVSNLSGLLCHTGRISNLRVNQEGKVGAGFALNITIDIEPTGSLEVYYNGSHVEGAAWASPPPFDNRLIPQPLIINTPEFAPLSAEVRNRIHTSLDTTVYIYTLTIETSQMDNGVLLEFKSSDGDAVTILTYLLEVTTCTPLESANAVDSYMITELGREACDFGTYDCITEFSCKNGFYVWPFMSPARMAEKREQTDFRLSCEANATWSHDMHTCKRGCPPLPPIINLKAVNESGEGCSMDAYNKQGCIVSLNCTRTDKIIQSICTKSQTPKWSKLDCRNGSGRISGSFTIGVVIMAVVLAVSLFVTCFVKYRSPISFLLYLV